MTLMSSSDIFQLDVTHQIKATDFGVGLRYETGRMDNALKINQFPGESFEQKITDQQGTTYDLFNVHSFTETWINKNLMLSSGFRVLGFGQRLSPAAAFTALTMMSVTSPGAQNGFGYYGLNGGSHLNEYVGNLNLFTRPAKNFTHRALRAHAAAEMRMRTPAAWRPWALLARPLQMRNSDRERPGRARAPGPEL